MITGRSGLREPDSMVEDDAPQPPSISYRTERSREEELSEIRLEIEALRRFMQSAHMESETQDAAELGAPPDYSSSRGDL